MAKKISKHVKTLSDFMKWLEQFNDGQYLFQGVSTHTHKIEAPAYRRLPEADRNNPNKLLKINQALIDKARLLGHDWKDGHYLSDLELLSELQYFGAATCLIDFTRSAQIALWFACQQSLTGEANGKVRAVRADDPVRFKTITPKLVTEVDIDYFFKEDENGRYPLYQWQPKQQNNRVIAQQSVFIFGGSQIEVQAECIILKSGKSEILDSLDNSAGITEASVYPDFDGFARQHAENKPYIESDVQSYLQRGVMAQMENNLDDAITYYGQVISLQPDSSILAKAYTARGSIYANKREYDLALADWTKAIALDPEDAGVYRNRGTAYLFKGELDKAIQDFNKAIDLEPKDAGVYNNRGLAYTGKSDFDLAIQDFNKAIDLEPENANAYNNRGLACAGKSDFDLAIQDFNKVIDLEPEDVGVYNNRGHAYAGKSDFDLAIQDYSKAIELVPEDAGVYNNRGHAYYRKGELDKAIQDYSKAIELVPEDAGVYNNRGVVYAEQSDFDAAIADYTKAIELDPEDANAYDKRGFAYHNIGDFATAIEDYSKAIELDPHSDTYCDRGEAWLHLKEWQKAKADLMTAKDMGYDIVASFQNDYESVEDFEAKNGVKLPKDIAALLSDNTT